VEFTIARNPERKRISNQKDQKILTFGLTPHFQKVFTMVGMTKYTSLHPDEKSACAAFE